MKYILLVFSILIAFTGCQKLGNDAKQNSQNTKQETKTADTTGYNIKLFKKTYKNCNENDEKCSYIKVSYPEFKGNNGIEINKVLEAYIVDSVFNVEGKVNKSLDGLATTFFNDYEQVIKDAPADFPVTYALDIASSIVFNKPKVLSISINEYINTGGAHPNSFIKNFVFNPQNGKQIKLSDVFINGFDTKLNSLIDSKFRTDKGLKPGEKLNGEKGGLFEDYIKYNDNFIFTNDGIEFLYNRYEIAAYVYGEIIVKFKYKELDELLKPEYKF